MLTAAAAAASTPVAAAGVCCAFGADGTLVIDPDAAEEQVGLAWGCCGGVSAHTANALGSMWQHACKRDLIECMLAS
jgi:hypothetical protein